MSKSTAKVTKKAKVKKANGFAFFSLFDSDNVIECNDSCHNFIPINEVADYSTLDTFIEVYTDEPEILEEILEEMPVVKPFFEIFEFREIDVCGDFDGRIIVASVNTESGVIFFQKEGQSISSETMIYDKDLVEPISSEIMIYDNDNVEEEYSLSPFQRKMTVCNWDGWRHRKGENYKPMRNNRKTLLDRKVQRDNSSLLREIKFTSFEEEDFYEENFFLISDALEFDREEDDEDYFLLGALA